MRSQHKLTQTMMGGGGGGEKNAPQNEICHMTLFMPPPKQYSVHCLGYKLTLLIMNTLAVIILYECSNNTLIGNIIGNI